MAARALWTGSISVGLLSIPIKLFPAVKRKSIAFNQVDEVTGSRIRYQKVSEATGEIVPNEHIVKGYDLGGERYVIVADDDLKPLAPAKSKEIGIDSFVPAEQLPTVMFDASYIVGPGKLGAKPYALLALALADSGRVAIGKFVMRQKEYLAAVRSDGERLTLSTLVFADEIVEPSSEEDLDVVNEVELSDREVTMAHSLVEAMSDSFDPDAYRDTYRASVMQLIEAKAEGRVLEVDEYVSGDDNVVDLAAALEASVAAAKESRGRHPTSRTSRAASAEPSTETAAPPARRAAKVRKSA